MNRKIRVAIVGCGVISDNHICSVLKNAQCEIVALCDIIKSRAKAKSERHGIICSIYDDYECMIESETLDVVHILTPHNLHTQMTIYALDRDINVFLEKPICINEDDIDKIKEAEKKSKATVCVCLQNRFNHTTTRAMEIAAEDGGVQNAFATVVWNRTDDYYRTGDWRGKWATEGGGVLINQAIHTIDLLCFLLGCPKKVQANISRMRHSDIVEVEDTCSAIIDYENNKRACIFATTTFSGNDTTMLHMQTKNRTIEIRNAHLYVNGVMEQMPECADPIGKRCYGTSHTRIIDEFYNALSEGRPAPVTIDDAAVSLKVILGAYRSKNNIIDIL